MKSRPSDSCLCKLSSTWCFKIIRRTARRCRKTIHAFHSWQQATRFYYISCFWSYYLTGAHCRYFGMWWREDSRKHQWLSFTCWWELNYWFCAGLKPTCDLPSWRESKRARCDAGPSLTTMSKVGNRYIFLQPRLLVPQVIARPGNAVRGGSFITLRQLSVKVALITLKCFWKL